MAQAFFEIKPLVLKALVILRAVKIWLGVLLKAPHLHLRGDF